MTVGLHMMGVRAVAAGLSYLIRKSQSLNIRHNKQCAVDLSTLELVVGIGNRIGLTAQHGSRVDAPPLA